MFPLVYHESKDVNEHRFTETPQILFDLFPFLQLRPCQPPIER